MNAAVASGTALAEEVIMQLLRVLVTAALPFALVVSAFLGAQGLIAMAEGAAAASESFVAQAAANVARVPSPPPGAAPILDRNPFEHGVRLRPAAAPEEAATDAPPLCVGVRPLVVVGHEDQRVAFAALDANGTRLLRRRGGDVNGKRVAFVGWDRVWLEDAAGLCQAVMFVTPPSAVAAVEATKVAPADDLTRRIVKTGPTEFLLERATVERILEAQQELMKARLVPDKVGERTLGMKISGIKPGSVLAAIGIENGDRLETVNGYEVANPERILEAYARLRNAERLAVVVNRSGKTTTLDYVIR